MAVSAPFTVIRSKAALGTREVPTTPSGETSDVSSMAQASLWPTANVRC
jgi:hypothetical protein